MAILISGGVSIIGSTMTAFPPPPLDIGESFGGGYYAGLYSASGDGNPTHFLVVSPGSSETTLSWKGSLTSTPGTGSLFNGSANTDAMGTSGVAHPAADYCYNLVINGYSDWYLPSFYELHIIYSNTRVGPGDNSTTSGINPYSVLPRTTNYSLYVPGVGTYATVFRNATAQFNGGNYWTSSQSSTFSAWVINTTNGADGVAFKDGSLKVRAIRKVPYYTQQTNVSYGPYRYWRMYITKVKDVSNNAACQMAEFKFQVNGIDRDLYGATLTNFGGGTTFQEEVFRLIDNTLDFKFYNGPHITNQYTDIRFDFGTPVSFTGYRWATANDVEGRDPEAWTIQAGTTTTSYTTIHTVTGYSATSARNTWQNPWTFT